MKIQKVGIVGAGNMGSGIAQKIAQEGIQVVMVDVENRFVQNGMENIKNTISEAVKRGILTIEQTEVILNRIRGTTNKEELKDADIVIEAVFEDIDVSCEDIQEEPPSPSQFPAPRVELNSVSMSDGMLDMLEDFQ